MGHGGARLDEKGVRGRTDYMDRVLRDKRYKVWLEKGPKISRLYDLKTDPMERNNLVKSPKLIHVAALNKFQEIVDSQPRVDARPQYRPRKANAWDRKPKESLKPKRGNRKNQKEKNGNK
jgi:arylsulfatase A-like enzyme